MPKITLVIPEGTTRVLVQDTYGVPKVHARESKTLLFYNSEGQVIGCDYISYKSSDDEEVYHEIASKVKTVNYERSL
jgi:hypothetical protein